MEFPDQPFLISQPPESHPFGNPQPGWEPVPADEVNQWMHDYYAVPNEYNGFRTLSGYWMEDSHGRIGVDVDVFGPYLMPGKLHEYGLGQFNGAVGNQASWSWSWRTCRSVPATGCGFPRGGPWSSTARTSPPTSRSS